MNRRDFMGTVAGGIPMAKLGVAGLYGYGEEAAVTFGANSDAGSVSQGAWIKGGLILAGGTHEPYSFVVRRGGQALDAHQHYEYEQSEELIKQLHDQGIEVFYTHLYKGFGMAAEKAEMEETRKAVAIAHRYGMKAATYVQWNTMMYETFFAEEPRATGWIQRDALGQPIMLTYGYQQSFRYRPCFSNQEYLDYLKKILRYAIVEVKTDYIDFDNFDLNAEPDSCHCNICKAGFRKYLKTKYSPEQRKERFGFENVDYVNPPLWNRSNPPEKLDIIFDPAFQEWIDYRCQTVADALSQIASFIRSLNPDVAIEINFGGLAGNNNPWTRGNDHRRLLPYTQAIVDEQDRAPEYLPDGRLITTIRTYKMARAYGNIVLIDRLASELANAENLAFNQTIGTTGEDPLTPEMLKYISFYRKRRDLYVGTKDVASVAVFRSYPSITYHHSRAGLSAILVEQALIQAKIPFHLFFEEHLRDLSPATCKTLILPNSECLSDEQIASIRRFVEAGGGLVATEQTGLYDAWRRLRVKPGLEGLIDKQPAAASYEEKVANVQVRAGTPARKRFGAGRVVYLPGIEFDGPLPPTEAYFELGTAFWKLPKNWKQVLDAVMWASEAHIPLQVTGPDFLVINLVEQADKRRRLIHLVNYNSQVPSLENIGVKCALPEKASANAVRLYSPDSDTYQTVDFRMEGAQAVFSVPRLNTYCMIAVSW
jgi:hypothetical protein